MIMVHNQGRIKGRDSRAAARGTNIHEINRIRLFSILMSYLKTLLTYSLIQPRFIIKMHGEHRVKLTFVPLRQITRVWAARG